MYLTVLRGGFRRNGPCWISILANTLTSICGRFQPRRRDRCERVKGGATRFDAAGIAVAQVPIISISFAAIPPISAPIRATVCFCCCRWKAAAASSKTHGRKGCIPAIAFWWTRPGHPSFILPETFPIISRCICHGNCCSRTATPALR